MYVVNLEMDNSLKWFLFNIVSGQMANDSFSKWGEVFLLRIWLCFFFLFLRALVNIPKQTLIISPWLLFHNMIISQLELGPPVDWLIELPPFCKNMLKITKSNARPGRSVSEEPPLVTLRTSDKLIRVQIDSSKSLIKYNLFIDEINRFNFRFHGDLLKQTKTHILALQGAIVFKYTGITCVYISAQIDSTPYPRR